MISRKIWPMTLMLATAANAAALPLKPGTYVLAGTSCHEPPFAATFDYNGRRFSYPHASDCRSIVRAHSGKTYHVAETCAALGDGSATVPTTLTTSYTILSHVLVRVRQGHAKTDSSYRWCPSPAGKNDHE